MTRREFLECDYYEAKFDGLDPQTTHVLCKSMDDIVEFTDEAAAQTAELTRDAELLDLRVHPEFVRMHPGLRFGLRRRIRFHEHVFENV